MENAKKKILIIDDEELLRELISDFLQSSGFESVYQASNGIDGKNIIKLEKPDFVISDIKMPGIHGIELLHWITKEHPQTKVLLITGDCNIMERAEAIQVGAIGLLNKPFEYDELFKILEENGGAPSKQKPPETNIEMNYFQVSLSEFITGTKSPYPLFIKLSKKKFIKIINQDDIVDIDDIERLKRKGIKSLYLRKEDYEKYIRLVVKINEAIKSNNNIKTKKKKEFALHTNEVILEQLYHIEFNREDFEQARNVLNSTIDLVTSNSKLNSLIVYLKNLGVHAYAHNLGVSLYAVMLSKQLGWHSPKTISFLSIGGLFHDIGKKKFDINLNTLTEDQMSSEEMKVYQKHPLYGAEILTNISEVPSEVLQIILQHHEKNNGTGFPFGLSHTTIFPPAQIIAIINQFIQLVLPPPSKPPLTPTEACNKLIDENDGDYNKDMLTALKQLLKTT